MVRSGLEALNSFIACLSQLGGPIPDHLSGNGNTGSRLLHVSLASCCDAASVGPVSLEIRARSKRLPRRWDGVCGGGGMCLIT